jgi:hypothetical protein
MTYKTAAVCLCAVVLGGCSSVNVVKNPGPGDNGIRYYRPKPYLLVTPADPTGRMVKLEILQLPDYCEEYSIHPKGKKPPAVQLKDGWNLVGVGGGGAPPAAPEAAPAPLPAEALKLPEQVLQASNVPIGLYESVFDVAGPVKFLKGWRYVGFSPWGSGGPPNGTDAQGVQNLQKGCPPCVAPGSVVQGPLYGIVFFNGAMTFRQIDEIANNMTCPTYVPTVPPHVAPQPGTGGARVPAGTPGTGGATTPPASEEEIKTRSSTPSVPATNPSTSLNIPRPYSLTLDAGVQQASRTVRRSGANDANMTRTSSTPKAVNQKKLEALEAAVFKSLDYSPAAGARASTAASSSYTAGDPVVPPLTPAMPIK